MDKEAKPRASARLTTGDQVIKACCDVADMHTAAKTTYKASDIIKAVAFTAGIAVADLKSGRNRTLHLIIARHAAMILMRQCTTLSYPSIAQKVGLTKHTSAMHAVKSLAANGTTKSDLYKKDLLEAALRYLEASEKPLVPEPLAIHALITRKPVSISRKQLSAIQPTPLMKLAFDAAVSKGYKTVGAVARVTGLKPEQVIAGYTKARPNFEPDVAGQALRAIAYRDGAFRLKN